MIRENSPENSVSIMANEISAIAGNAAAASIKSTLRGAAAKTGIGFDYLLRTAQRESSLNPNAKATTSSAAGMFQFIEQTWLAMVKNHGASHGMADFAADIKESASGQLTVTSAVRRQEILDLRFNVEKAAALAGELARENKTQLEAKLGRAVNAAELYAAHFLGTGGAAKLLAAPANAAASTLLPAAAKANKAVFFEGARSRTAGEVMDAIGRSMGLQKSTSNAPVMTSVNDGASMAERAAKIEKAGRAQAASPEKASVSLEQPSVFVKTLSLQDLLSKSASLSPLALAILQAFNPTDIARR